MFDRKAYEERVKWFTHDRFGMFIHWGLYAIPARGEWVRSTERISVEDYEKYFREFNPTDFDPKAWAKAAKRAGMKYAVLTAKHHDGFCLFDSKYTSYKSTNTPCGRDLVREYLDAFRAEGLKVGLYYSLLDWHHPDYPKYGDAHHPMRDNESFKGERINFDNYVTYLHSQVEELVSGYGKLDILWFDFSYGEMRAEKWRAEELIKMIRSYQGDIITDNRLEVSGEGFGSLLSDEPTPYCGDFVSPEQIIPPKGIFDSQGRPAVWEACITMNNSWGFTRDDKAFKSAPTIIHKLVECVSKGGNLLLNVGPDARGRIPQESLERLESIGQWMENNARSIEGCGVSGMAKPEICRVTRNGRRLYYHFTEACIGGYPLEGLKADDIESIRLLSNGAEVRIAGGWAARNYPNTVFADLGPEPELPDATDTVLEVTLK